MSAPATTLTMTELIEDYSAAWASRDAERIASYHADDGVFQLHSGAAGPVQGKDAIRDTFSGLLAFFPDLTFVEQQLVVADWGWTVQWTMSGTVAVPYPIGDGREAPVGSRFEIDALDLITVDDGRLTQKHTYLDWQAALDQLAAA